MCEKVEIVDQCGDIRRWRYMDRFIAIGREVEKDSLRDKYSIGQIFVEKVLRVGDVQRSLGRSKVREMCRDEDIWRWWRGSVRCGEVWIYAWRWIHMWRVWRRIVRCI